MEIEWREEENQIVGEIVFKVTSPFDDTYEDEIVNAIKEEGQTAIESNIITIATEIIAERTGMRIELDGKKYNIVGVTNDIAPTIIVQVNSPEFNDLLKRVISE